MDYPWLEDFVTSGRVIDLILGIVVVEAIALIVFRRAMGHGLSAIDTLANLASGACLLLAVRMALVRASWMMIVIALLAALAAHLYDLSRRWNKSSVAGVRSKDY